jgi:hypothetical protein
MLNQVMNRYSGPHAQENSVRHSGEPKPQAISHLPEGQLEDMLFYVE